MSSGQHPFVIIVDDVHENARILHRLLREDGYSFGVAHSAYELFAILQERDADLILLDVMMPGMDGFAAMAQLRENPRYLDLPVIFVTAKYGLEDRLRGFEAGCVDYITKPFQGAEVRARVRTHVTLRRALLRQQSLVEELRTSLAKVHRLEGLIPICARCKSVRDDEGYWREIDQYLAEMTDVEFTHGLCPRCAAELFPGEVK